MPLALGILALLLGHKCADQGPSGSSCRGDSLFISITSRLLPSKILLLTISNALLAAVLPLPSLPEPLITLLHKGLAHLSRNLSFFLAHAGIIRQNTMMVLPLPLINHISLCNNFLLLPASSLLRLLLLQPLNLLRHLLQTLKLLFLLLHDLIVVLFLLFIVFSLLTQFLPHSLNHRSLFRLQMLLSLKDAILQFLYKNKSVSGLGFRVDFVSAATTCW